jgi:hypothetical protein
MDSSKSDRDIFKYDALQDKEIRLLRCSGGPSTFQLSHVSFDNMPDYIALSYFWGDPTPCHVITCNGKQMMIAANLKKALAAVFAAIKRDGAPPLYEKDENISLWADGICMYPDRHRTKCCRNLRFEPQFCERVGSAHLACRFGHGAPLAA